MSFACRDVKTGKKKFKLKLIHLGSVNCSWWESDWIMDDRDYADWKLVRTVLVDLLSVLFVVRSPCVVYIWWWRLGWREGMGWDLLVHVQRGWWCSTIWFLAPFLEESGPMTTAIGSPQVAATGAAEAAIVPPVVAAATASDARSSGNINQRRTSEKRNKCKKKNAEK